VKNPSSVQSKSTGEESRSCSCTSEPMTGQIAVPEEPISPAVQGYAEQPAAGRTLQSRPGGPSLNGAKG